MIRHRNAFCTLLEALPEHCSALFLLNVNNLDYMLNIISRSLAFERSDIIKVRMAERLSDKRELGDSISIVISFSNLAQERALCKKQECALLTG